MASPYKASFALAPSNTSILPGSLCNDLLIWTGNSNQNILFGVSNVNTYLSVSGAGDLALSGNLTFSNQLQLSGIMLTQRTSATINNATSQVTAVDGLTYLNGNVLISMSNNQGSNTIQFLQNNTEYMRISSNGYVGIGKSNPASTLDVNGNISVVTTNSNNVFGGCNTTIYSSMGSNLLQTSNTNAYTLCVGNFTSSFVTGEMAGISFISGGELPYTYSNPPGAAIIYERTTVAGGNMSGCLHLRTCTACNVLTNMLTLSNSGDLVVNGSLNIVDTNFNVIRLTVLMPIGTPGYAILTLPYVSFGKIEIRSARLGQGANDADMVNEYIVNFLDNSTVPSVSLVSSTPSTSSYRVYCQHYFDSANSTLYIAAIRNVGGTFQVDCRLDGSSTTPTLTFSATLPAFTSLMPNYKLNVDTGDIVTYGNIGAGGGGSNIAPYATLHALQAASIGNTTNTNWTNHGLCIQNGSNIWGLGLNGAQDLLFCYGSNNNNTNGNNIVEAFISRTRGGAAITFTGQHRIHIKDIPASAASNYIGLIVCANNDEYILMNDTVCKGKNAITIDESLPFASLCTKSNDKTVFGVIANTEDPESRTDKYGSFVSCFKKERGDTRIFVNSLGEGAIWVSDANGPLESGDYITSSAIHGYGQKQNSEFLSTYTVAKITMNCDFNPIQKPIEIIKTKPVTNIVYQCDDKQISIDEYVTLSNSDNYSQIEVVTYENDLDNFGSIQWVSTSNYEYAYNIRYLDSYGKIIDYEQYLTSYSNNERVYRAAFVGCTYHCG